MLSQARAISSDVTPSPLEAALLKPDENQAVARWVPSLDLSARSRQPSPHCPFGPFASADTLDQFAALAHAGRVPLTSG
jgi:hypothetical protein